MKINKCIDCGIEIDKRSKRCCKCSGKKKLGIKNPIFSKTIISSNNPNWKGGYKNQYTSCSKCGKKTTSKKAKVCKSCYIESLKNKKPYNYKGGRPKCVDCGKLIWNGFTRCHVCASKKRWKSQEYRTRQVELTLKGLAIRPNKPETIVKNLLEIIAPNKFKYTGDGSFVLDRYNPDFIANDEKKIIEVYGDYWHNIPSNKQKDQGRLKVYNQHGYSTLIIWEHELEDLLKIKEKLTDFINQR